MQLLWLPLVPGVVKVQSQGGQGQGSDDLHNKHKDIDRNLHVLLSDCILSNVYNFNFGHWKVPVKNNKATLLFVSLGLDFNCRKYPLYNVGYDILC